MVEIHSTAIIEDGAIIEDEVKIGPYCIVGKDVIIKKGTVLQSHVVVEGITEIGENNTIYSFVSIGKANQDLKYKGEPTKTIIGNNNSIREFVTIHRGTDDRWETRIGSGNLLMAYVHVAHDVIIGDDCILANNVTLAGQVGVAGHLEIGDNTVIGAQSGIAGNVEANKILSGHPLVDHREDMKIRVAMKKLPELLKRVKALEEKK